VAPGFAELDEVQDLELRQRVWRDFMTSARAAGDPDMLALMAADVRPRDLDSAFATVCVNDDVEFPPGEAVCPDAKPAWKAIEKFWTTLQKHLPATTHQATTCGIQRASRHFRGQLRVSRYRLERPAVIASLLGTWNCDSTIVQKWWAELPAEKKRLRDLIQRLHQDFRKTVVEPYLSQWRQYVYRLSVTLLTRARDSATTERRRINSLNYGDLLNLTARVLRENAAVRRALQDKFRYLLVDEFQDTDPVQAEIVFWLAADGAASSASKLTVADWRVVPLRPGALFVVGDPKQSIYRFRRADIDIYNIVRQRFSDPAVGCVVPLTLNFRSVPQLSGWANQVFQTRFPAEPTAHAPRFAALDPSADHAASGGVFTLTHHCDYRQVHEEDARKIAIYIRSEVDAGRRQFSDFLILTRKKRNRLAPYAGALELLNIPIEVSGAGAFGESPEVETLTMLLRALADPQDTLALVAVLRGALFGVSDPELFAFKQGGGWFSIFQHEDSDASQPPNPVRIALAALGQFYRWTRVLPAAAALDRILEHTGYLAFAATTPGGVDAGDLFHAVDRVRQVVEEGGSLADAADSLEADCEAGNEVESLPLEPGRSNVVRLMNLHKAKGLEARVVFLADPNGGLTLRVDNHIERKDLHALGWFKVVQQSQGNSWGGKLLGEHADWSTHETAELPYRQAEEDRLLYVAATRARELLVISRWSGKHTPKAWGALNDFLTNASELAVPPSVTAQRVAPLDCSDEAQIASAVARLTVHQLVRDASWSITSVTAKAHHIARMIETADASADDPTKVVGNDTPAHRADAGMAWGSLIHGLLEHAMRQQDATAADLRRLGMWLTVEEPELRTVLDLAVTTVLQVARADFWTDAKQSEHSVETPFAFASSQDALLTGVIDLLFRHENGWQVIDYKTDVAATALAASYQQQLKMYERALDGVAIGPTTSRVHTVRIQADSAPDHRDQLSTRRTTSKP
jgi:ATP-dependent helicase/nuclease subunit A